MIIYMDLDGTIIDSSYRHIAVLKDVLDDNGLHFDITDYLDCKRNGVSTYTYLISNLKISSDIAKIIARNWIDTIEANQYLDLDILYPDSIPFLKYVAEKDYEIHYVTARNNKKGLYDELSRLGIDKYATRIIAVDTVDSISNKKKSIDFAHCFAIIGDTEVDYEVAVSSDVNYYILNRGFRSKGYWDARHIKSYDDLDCIAKNIFN